MSKQLVGPNGERIIGTLEVISAVALICNASKGTGDGGQFELEFSGDTQVYWDSQKTLERDGQRVFVDREGNEYLENTLKLIDE